MENLTYEELQKQIVELNKKSEQLRKQESSAAIKEAKRLIAAYGLTAADLGLDDTLSASKGKKQKNDKKVAKKAVRAAKVKNPGDKRSAVAPKFKDPVSGNSWSGRGNKPSWLTNLINQGASLEDFRIR